MLYIVAPVVIVLAYIYYLLQKINSLKSENAHLEANKNIEKTLDKLEEAKGVSDDKEAEYRDAVKHFNDEHNGDGH